MCDGTTEQIYTYMWARDPNLIMESCERPLILVFLEHTHTKEILWVQNLDSFPPWRLPSTPGQSVNDNSATPERFLCRNVRVEMEYVQRQGPALGGWGLRCPKGSFTGELWLLAGTLCMPDSLSDTKGSCSSDLTNQIKQPTSWADWVYFVRSMWHSQTGVPRTARYFKTKKNKKAAQKCHWEVDFYIYFEQTGDVGWMHPGLHYFLLP